MNIKTKAEFDYILDTFSGTDGGVRFVKFQALIVEMDKRYEEGTGRESYDSGKILDIMSKFKHLIEIAQRA
jgi:hypothetical protein